MLPWKFETFVSPTGRSDVQKTIDGYDDYACEALKRQVKHLAVSPKSQWDEPHAKKLKNEDPLYEIRYKGNRRQERAIGYFDEAAHVFVIAAIGYHKDRVYHPKELFQQARNRMDQIRSGQATTTPLQVDGEDFPADER